TTAVGAVGTVEVGRSAASSGSATGSTAVNPTSAAHRRRSPRPGAVAAGDRSSGVAVRRRPLRGSLLGRGLLRGGGLLPGRLLRGRLLGRGLPAPPARVGRLVLAAQGEQLDGSLVGD